MLHDLLKVKNIREESAEREVRRCQHELELAQQELRRRKQEVERRKQELQDYVLWRSQEEQRLYDNIMNTSVQQHDLDRLKQKVALMRDKDVALEQAITEAQQLVIVAQQQVAQAEQILESARQAHYKAKQAVKSLRNSARCRTRRLPKRPVVLKTWKWKSLPAKPRNRSHYVNPRCESQ